MRNDSVEVSENTLIPKPLMASKTFLIILGCGLYLRQPKPHDCKKVIGLEHPRLKLCYNSKCVIY